MRGSAWKKRRGWKIALKRNVYPGNVRILHTQQCRIHMWFVRPVIMSLNDVMSMNVLLKRGLNVTNNILIVHHMNRRIKVIYVLFQSFNSYWFNAVSECWFYNNSPIFHFVKILKSTIKVLILKILCIAHLKA